MPNERAFFSRPEENGFCILNTKKQFPKNNLYILSFFKKADILKFKNYIYKDCEMYLKRKYEKFNK